MLIGTRIGKPVGQNRESRNRLTQSTGFLQRYQTNPIGKEGLTSSIQTLTNHTEKKRNSTPILLHTQKLRWIIALKIKTRTIKPLEDYIGDYFCDFGVGRVFLGRTQKPLIIKN